MAKNLIIKKEIGIIKKSIIKKEIIMAKKIIVLALCAFFCSVSAKAQFDSVFHLESKYYYHEKGKPIVRFSKSTGVRISYFEKDFHGVFTMFDLGGFSRSIDLPFGHYVYDFEILDDHIYFCGEKVNSSTNSSAFVGKFDFNSFVFNQVSVQMSIDTFYLDRDTYWLNKMIVYDYLNPISQEVKQIVMAVGYGEDIGTVNNNGIDFFIAEDIANHLAWIDTFPNERYHDIIVTNDYVILAGIRLYPYFNNTIAFRKISKTNPISSCKDTLYYCDLPHYEPGTFIVGEHIIGWNNFVTATFANINGKDGTIIREYKADDMQMVNSQFIPSQWEKTQPFELKDMQKNKLLLLQGSTDGTEALVFHLNLSQNSNYSSIYESYQRWDCHSIDRYISNKYIAAGISATNPAFYIKDCLSSNKIPCITRKDIDIENTPNYTLTNIQSPMGYGFQYSRKIDVLYSHDNINIIIDCQ